MTTIRKSLGLKSPLWTPLFTPLWTSTDGSALAGGGVIDPGNTILTEDGFDILQEDSTYILQEA